MIDEFLKKYKIKSVYLIPGLKSEESSFGAQFCITHFNESKYYYKADKNVLTSFGFMNEEIIINVLKKHLQKIRKEKLLFLK